MRAESGSPPRIALNLLYLLPGEVGGTGTYAAGLLAGLAEVATEERFLVLVNQQTAHWPLPASDRFERIVCGVDGRWRGARYWFEQVHLPGLLHRLGVDLVHSLGYVSPLLSHCPRVVSIHDLNFLAFGDQMPWVRREALRLFVTASGRRAQAVLTASQFSRTQILRHLGIPSELVEVIPLAGPIIRPTAADATGWRPVNEPYLIAFGGRTPNKNLGRLIAAFQLAAPGQRLVIIGHVTEELRAAGMGAGIVFTGYLDQGRMEATLRQADLLVFPSTYEGFGLPVLEAMGLGVPVLCSTASALPEVAGDAACYFDPLDVSDMAEKIRGLAASPTRRQELVQRGIARAAEFSWLSTANQTMAVYRRLAGRPGTGAGPTPSQDEWQDRRSSPVVR